MRRLSKLKALLCVLFLNYTQNIIVVIIHNITYKKFCRQYGKQRIILEETTYIEQYVEQNYFQK
jgi:hypothetical protein